MRAKSPLDRASKAFPGGRKPLDRDSKAFPEGWKPLDRASKVFSPGKSIVFFSPKRP